MMQYEAFDNYVMIGTMQEGEEEGDVDIVIHQNNLAHADAVDSPYKIEYASAIAHVSSDKDGQIILHIQLLHRKD